MKKIVVFLLLSVTLSISAFSKETENVVNVLKENGIFKVFNEDGIKSRFKINLDRKGDEENLGFYSDDTINGAVIKIRVNDNIEKYEQPEQKLKYFFIADIDKNDKFIEFGFVSENSTKTQSQTVVYRYKKGKIIKAIEKPLDFEILGTNGVGGIYFEDGLIFEENIENFESDNVLRYYDINKKKIVENNIKTRVRRYEGDIAVLIYKTEKDIIEDEKMSSEEKRNVAEKEDILVGKLNKWDKFEILKVKKKTDHVKIKFENDKIGWIGGNIIK